MELSNKNLPLSKWEEVYAAHAYGVNDKIGFGILAQEHIENFNTLNILDKVSGEKDFVLEIGCGKAYVAHGLAKLGKMVIGIDFVFGPLLFAKRKFEEDNLKGIFLRCDMFNLPFKEGVFSFIYSLGVLEHHLDMNQPVNEIKRVLKRQGITFHTVPAISVPSLTYAQLWGNIPYIKGIKEIFFWIHHVLLKGVHCKYGYEFSYLESHLLQMFKKHGFLHNQAGKFNITVPVYSITNKFLRSLARKVIGNRLFTRHIYIVSQKSF
ncbi:MAG: hypothetical protein A3G92_07450 [Deltaproteobacteria bacterium RIFCSPLOWO2_12_FULL_38_8]|nr:MAG: hypothetical protein A3G92_07450 [Deltaproteobacteria bacterium RIFCSPLOWO2_12_FULL_38_8]